MKGVCKLCGVEDQLKVSHIMPDFFIRSMEASIQKGSHGQSQPHSLVVSTRPDIQDGWKQRGGWQRQLGWTEHLLCGDCEQKFAIHEGKIRDFFYGNAPPPLGKRALGKIAAPLTRGAPQGLLEVRGVEINYRELKLFQMSLLWRASVAKGQFFRNVDLGQKHENRLRDLLARDDPGQEQDYPCIMFDLQSGLLEFEGFWREPTVWRDEDKGQRLYKIIIGGYAFMYSVSSQAPSQGFREYAAKSTGKMILLVVKGDIFIQKMISDLRKAGKL